ncbi:MAG: L-threonylcarbamoyladenylate synthase [Planctomycetota bacterium]
MSPNESTTEFRRLAPGPSRHEAIARAAKALQDGGVVVLPTETVYGIAACADRPDAIARLRRLKGRADTKPFQLLVGSVEEAQDYAAAPGRVAGKLMRCFWPGPLTLVLPAAASADPLLTDAQATPPTVGLRLPDHAETRAILRESGCTLVAASANPEGEPSACNAKDALRYFDGKVDLVLDGGPVTGGMASTVLAVRDERLELLRAGAIPETALRETARYRILFAGEEGAPGAAMAAVVCRHMLAARHVDAAVEAAAPGLEADRDRLPRAAVEALHEMGYPIDEPDRTFLTERALDRADIVYALSEPVREQLVADAPAAGERVRLLELPARPDLPAGHPGRRIMGPNYHEIAVALEQALWEPCKQLASELAGQTA